MQTAIKSQDLLARISGYQVGWLLENILDQLQRMTPNKRAEYVHSVDKIIPQIQKLNREIIDNKLHKQTFAEVDGGESGYGNPILFSICHAIDCGVKI